MSLQPTYRPCAEALEQRELLTASLQAYVTGGNLYVLSTAGPNVINVVQSGSQVYVSGTSINVKGANVSAINASSIAKVIVYGNNGNDDINLTTLKSNALVYTGPGNDQIACGTGSDVVNSGGGFDWIFRPYNPSTPVVNGASAADIQQGNAPLCQTDAALADAANEGYNFANNIKYLGSDWYQVKLYGNLPTQKVYYNGWTSSNDPVVPANGEFWPVLMQRARLQALGINPDISYTTSQWNAMNQQTGGRLLSVSEAIYDFTGRTSTYIASASATPQALQAALARGDYVIVQSETANSISALGIIGDHAYAVLSVYYQAGIWKVRLYNPWGVDSENGVTIDSLDTAQPAANDGFITLSWQQFTSKANFTGYFDAKPVTK